MNLVDAVKTGLPIRLTCWHLWYAPDVTGRYISQENVVLQLRIAHIVSDDWEVKEVAVEVTSALWDEAVRQGRIACGKVGWISGSGEYTTPALDVLLRTMAKHLGLKIK